MRRMYSESQIENVAENVAESVVNDALAPESLAEKFEGAVGVSVDVNEGSDKVSVGLDLTGGTAGKVLTIDSTGNDVEWKEVGGGKLYMHNIYLATNQSLSQDVAIFRLVVYNSSPTQFTITSLKTFLYQKARLPVSGFVYDTNLCPIVWIFANSPTNLTALYLKGTSQEQRVITTYSTFTDTVVEI